MRKTIYILVICTLLCVIAVTSLYLFLSTRQPKIINVEVTTEEPVEIKNEPQTVPGVVVEEKQKEEVPVTEETTLPAAEYKSFEDTIDELIEATE